MPAINAKPEQLSLLHTDKTHHATALMVPAKLCASEVPCLGSAWSSPVSSQLICQCSQLCPATVHHAGEVMPTGSLLVSHLDLPGRQAT